MQANARLMEELDLRHLAAAARLPAAALKQRRQKKDKEDVQPRERLDRAAEGQRPAAGVEQDEGEEEGDAEDGEFALVSVSRVLVQRELSSAWTRGTRGYMLGAEATVLGARQQPVVREACGCR